MRNIRTLIDGGVRNFALANYLDRQGKTRPMYEMNRKGFSILVMGFTGEKAMKFKNDFVDAFEAMEAELLKQQQQQISYEQVKLLAQTVLDQDKRT